MKYNRDAEREAKKESLRQSGYREDMTKEEKQKCLAIADQLFQEYLDECASIEEEEEEVYRMSEIKYRRNRDAA